MNEEHDRPGEATDSQFVTRQVTIRSRPITHIDAFEVLEHELDDLADSYAQANDALNFTIGLAGLCVAFLMPILTSWQSLEARAIGLLAGLALASGIGCLWFLIRWHRKRKRGPELLARIKSRRPEITMTEVREGKSSSP